MSSQKISLQNISNPELLARMEKLVRTERKITHLILVYILEIEARRIYADLGYDGMYTYLTRGLGYSEAAAYRRLQSARLLKSVPEVAEKIEAGSLNLSQLTQVQQCVKETLKQGASFSPADTREVLKKLENKNTFDTKILLAQEFDLPVKTTETVTPQKDESVCLSTVFSAEQWAEIQKAKSHLSHVVTEGDWAAVFTAFAKKVNQKFALKEPNKIQKSNKDYEADRSRSNNSHELDERNESNRCSKSNETNKLNKTNKVNECAEIQKSKSHLADESDELKPSNKSKTNIAPEKKQSVIATTVKKESISSARPREYISIHTKRKLLAKANGCCEYRNPETGVRCQSTYQIQIDHLKPWAYGGGNNIENLRILCGVHNRHVFRWRPPTIRGSSQDRSFG